MSKLNHTVTKWHIFFSNLGKYFLLFMNYNNQTLSFNALMFATKKTFLIPIRLNKKNMCGSGYILKEIRVCRQLFLECIDML